MSRRVLGPGAVLALAVLFGLVSAPGAPAGGAGPKADKPALSFVFVGCNRVASEDWDPKENPSSANVPQLKQTFKDVAALDRTPELFFFTGDLVMNLEADDGTVLRKQLGAWADLYKKAPIKGKTTLVPFPGNHEMLMDVAAKKKDDKKHDEIEVPNKASVAVWKDWIKGSGFDTYATRANGPKPGDSKDDNLVDDQSEMTYSFDAGSVHFVLINTDTISSVIDPDTKYPYAAWVPLHWVKKDVEVAQLNPKVSAIFLLGHKPIMVKPDHEEDAILNTPKYPLADSLQKLFKANNKVRAYLCAHEHEWDCAEFKHAPGVYQVVAGNGGSPLKKKWLGGGYYGFSEIRVFESGTVALVNHRRPLPPAPQKYFEGTPVAPPAAKPDKAQVLFPGQ